MRLPVNVPQPLLRAAEKRKLLRVPAPAKLRIAQITPGVQFESTYFPAERWGEMAQFCPEMLVGAAADLQWLAEKTRVGEISLGSIDHAVFVCTSTGDAPADDRLRVVLWQAFGVPVYELFVGADGTVLAGECEAHEGWHVEPGCRFYRAGGEELVADSRQLKGIRTGLSGIIEREPCVCGRWGARLMEPQLRAAAKGKLLLAATA